MTAIVPMLPPVAEGEVDRPLIVAVARTSPLMVTAVDMVDRRRRRLMIVPDAIMAAAQNALCCPEATATMLPDAPGAT